MLAFVELDQAHTRQPRQLPAISQVALAVARHLGIQHIQAGQGHGRMHLVEFGIHAQLLDIVRRVKTETTHVHQLGRQLGVVGGDIAALEAIEQFARMQGEALGPAEAADFASGIGFIDRLDGVDKQRNAAFLRQRFQSYCIAAVHDRMHAEDQRGLLVQMRAHGVGAQRQGLRVDLAEARHQVGPGRHIGHAPIGQRGHDDFPTPRQRQAFNRQHQRPEAAAKGHAMAGLVELGQTPLQLLHQRPVVGELVRLIEGARILQETLEVRLNQA